jgi:hypothetical protein
VSQRTGWIILVVGAGVCLVAWCAFSLALHLYVIEAGRRMFD